MRAAIEAGMLEARDPDGQTPMHMGASGGKNRGIRLLIDQGDDVNHRRSESGAKADYINGVTLPLEIN